ncbi:hypothetical protein ANN_06872 [Periplaneta americana]|uniref:Uncharacterized protein n=1 Tax=Periplaneta americana TaxID=6978 RepID=A0ABQ8TFL3_PERAM|nr:hypothetical protein ANN_06872 [Periplaneta americana]
MNVDLQGKNKYIGEMDFLKSYPKTSFKKDKYETGIDTVLNELEARFSEFQNFRDIVQYMACPFKSDLDVKKTAALFSEIFGISKLCLEN